MKVLIVSLLVSVSLAVSMLNVKGILSYLIVADKPTVLGCIMFTLLLLCVSLLLPVNVRKQVKN